MIKNVSILFVFSPIFLFSQVGINTNNPQATFDSKELYSLAAEVF